MTVAPGQTVSLTFGNQIARGKICVSKYWDKNSNGKQDAGEPSLPGWVFTVSTTPASTLTSGVEPVCVSVPPGPYTVTETPQTGWIATAPPSGTQTVTVAAGQTVSLTFGNHRIMSGQICVLKYWDKNGNGKQDAGEPALPGWVFTVGTSPPCTLKSVAKPVCVSVPPGTYTVSETGQTGWMPTAPPSGTQNVTVAEGQTVVLKFGNKTCCLTLAFQAGKADNFSVADGIKEEPATPSPRSTPPNLQTYFDQATGNAGFWHRFTLPAGNCVKKVWLRIHLKALGDVPTNDAMHFFSGSQHSSYSIAALHAGTWNIGDTGTFLIPVAPALIGALDTASPRFLDVYVQDDTSVDYVRLTVQFCACIKNVKAGVSSGVSTAALSGSIAASPPARTPTGPGAAPAPKPAQPCCLDFLFQAGKADNFSVADGIKAEPATPSPRSTPPNLQTYFDQTTNNTGFWHRFTLPAGNCVKQASLRIHLKALSTDANNDALDIYSGSQRSSYVIKALNGGTWTTGTGTFLIPVTPALIGPLNVPGLRFLDIHVQDDTSVDYISLTVTFCECHKIPPPKP